MKSGLVGMAAAFSLQSTAVLADLRSDWVNYLKGKTLHMIVSDGNPHSQTAREFRKYVFCRDKTLKIVNVRTTGPGGGKGSLAADSNPTINFDLSDTVTHGYWDINTSYVNGEERGYLFTTFDDFSIPSQSLRLYYDASRGSVLLNGVATDPSSGTESYCF